MFHLSAVLPGTQIRVTTDLPALLLLAPGTYYCYKSHQCVRQLLTPYWTHITWKGMPVLFDLGHLSLTSLLVCLGMPRLEFLSPRQPSLSYPQPFFPHVLSLLLELALSFLPILYSAPCCLLASCISQLPPGTYSVSNHG